jgi:thiol:disulfide interchange protein DsbD
MKHLIPVLALLFATSVFGQSNKQVQWNFTSKKIAENTYEIHMTATVNGSWHLYAQEVGVDGPVPTTFSFTKNPLLVIDKKVKEEGKLVKKKEEVWGGVVNYYENKVNFIQVVKLKSNAKTNVAGKVEFMVCNDSQCLPPSTVDFKVNIGG